MKRLEREIRHCEVCGKEFECIISSKKVNCSKICGYKNPNKLIKRKSTCIKKYGVDNAFKSIKIKEKIKQSKFELYGDENYGCYGSKSFKENLLNKYGDAHYSNQEKGKETCIKKYGVDNAFKSIEIKEKFMIY